MIADARKHVGESSARIDIVQLRRQPLHSFLLLSDRNHQHCNLRALMHIATNARHWTCVDAF
jgi:hypothetical protein